MWRRLRNLWRLGSFEPPMPEQPMPAGSRLLNVLDTLATTNADLLRGTVKGEGKIISSKDPADELIEAIRKEDTGAA